MIWIDPDDRKGREGGFTIEIAEEDRPRHSRANQVFRREFDWNFSALIGVSDDAQWADSSELCTVLLHLSSAGLFSSPPPVARPSLIMVVLFSAILASRAFSYSLRPPPPSSSMALDWLRGQVADEFNRSPHRTCSASPWGHAEKFILWAPPLFGHPSRLGVLLIF